MTTKRIPNQHGVAINPTNDDLVRQVSEALTPHGGERFVTPDAGDDALTVLLVEFGRIWPQRVVQSPRARHSACHEVAETIQATDPKRYAHVFGYALTDSDQMWRTHSWVYDREKDRVVEPTPTKRNKYFGVVITP